MSMTERVEDTKQQTRRGPASSMTEAERLAGWWGKLTDTEPSVMDAEYTLAFNIPKDLLAQELREAASRGTRYLNGVRPRLQEVESELRAAGSRRMPRPPSHTGETIGEILARSEFADGSPT